MEWFLIIIFVIIMGFEYHVKKTFFNVNTLIMAPYVVIIIINNWIATKFGYDRILPQIVLMTSAAILIFYLGTLFYKVIFNRRRVERRTSKKKYIFNLKAIEYYVICVLMVRFFQLAFMFYRYGLSYMIQNDFQEMQISGIVAHLMLSIYPLLAILFYNGLKEKKRRYIILVAFAFLIVFTTFIKYHIISLLLIIYIYCSIKDKKYFVKGGQFVFIGIIFAFMFNYFISFVLRDMSISNTFLFYKLWTYLGGGSINCNWLIYETSNNYNIFDFIVKSIIPLPNMVIAKVIGNPITVDSIGFGLQQLGTSIGGRISLNSNVINTIGDIYAINSIPIFTGVMFCWGFISERIFSRAINDKEERYKLFCTMFITFNMLSFFANYFVLSATWELLIWSSIIIPIFQQRKTCDV